MRLLFIIDPLMRLNPRKDSTIALMRAAARRQDTVFSAQLNDIIVTESGLSVKARQLTIYENHAPWHEITANEYQRADAFDAALMRVEPPVNQRFLQATLLLDKFPIPIINCPRALREFNEKLAILAFPKLIAPTIISADFNIIADFHARYNGAVIKPLDGMGGRGIYVSPAKDMNLRSVVESLSDNGHNWLIAQKYLPAAREGDSRVFVINGIPSQWMLCRIPREDDHRGNLAAGGKGEARPISDAAKKIAEAVGPSLVNVGILFAGLDVIGDALTEINITCPTGLREVRDQTDNDLAENIIAAVHKITDH